MFDSDTFASKKPDNRTSDQPVDIFVQSDPNQMDNSNLLSKTIENGLDIYSGFFDALFDSPHLGYLILDTNGFILATNKKFEEMVKTEGKEIISKSFSEFISTKNDLFTQSQLINFYDSPKDKHLDLWINRKEDKPLLTRINGFLSNSTRLTGQCSASRLLVVVADIKTTIPAKENLNYIESRYKVIADSSPIAISIIQNGKIVFANAALEKMLNYLSDQLIGIEVLSVIASEFHEMLKERIIKISTPNENSSGLSHLPVEIKMIKRDKTFSLVEAFFSSTLFDENRAILMQFIEISERKKSLDIYYRSQKLESLGLLASGIAHDFNNLLGGIFGFIDISRNFAESNDSASVIIHLSKALQVYDKAKKLTQQLLTFSKGGAPQKKILTINDTIDNTVQLALCGSNIEHSIYLPPDLHSCNFDPDQIRLVIENIITNAKEAMPHGGKLTIHCENYTIWPDTILPLQAGSYLKITIKDTGPGIPEDIIGKIFDPFFTTRLMGSGLGLTTSYSIIKKHGGYIDAISEPGNGAVFSLYLPASQAMELKKTSNSQVSNGGRILIVDDEDFIREVASQILKKAGYKTYLAANCDEACALYQQAFDQNEHIDFIILDLTIPGGPSGAEIAIKLRQINPDSIFIVASGYSDDPVMANPMKYGFSASISKPFRIHELTDILIKARPMGGEDVRYLISDI